MVVDSVWMDGYFCWICFWYSGGQVFMEWIVLLDLQLCFFIYFLEMFELLVCIVGGDVGGVCVVCGLGYEGGEEVLSLVQFECLMCYCLLYLKLYELVFL